VELITLRPTKDTFLSNNRSASAYNFGQANTLEASVSAFAGVNYGATRALLSFPVESVTSTLTGSYSAVLTLFDAKSFRFTDEDFVLEIYPIVQQWSEGNGSISFPLTGSANWSQATALSAWTTAGGSYTSSPSASVSFQAGTENLTAALTSFVEYWKTYQNYGVIVKLPDSIESTTADYSSAKSFFARNTHTFFVPKLEITYQSGRVTDDRMNLHVGQNTFFFVDTNVSTLSYPGKLEFKSDLTVSSATAATLSSWATNVWYSTFQNLDGSLPELWSVLTNTGSNYSLTAAVTGTAKSTAFTNDVSRLKCSAATREVYSADEAPVLRFFVSHQVALGMGTLSYAYYPDSVSVALIEKKSRSFATPWLDTSYDADGFFKRISMSNLLVGFTYVPVVKIVDGPMEDVVFLEMKESEFYVQKSLLQ
jgi:hypothetical protein